MNYAALSNGKKTTEKLALEVTGKCTAAANNKHTQ